MTKILRDGDGVVIPPNQEHSARIPDKPAKAMDAWYLRNEEGR